MSDIRIAIYLRLSKEDDKKEEESNSIHMQRRMILSFVQKHFTDYKIVEFVDDGYSGTNFERPGITALFELARSGGIDSIIVKDFSRFSRDYIELGTYIEQIFPFLGIRFISINDGYDSEQDGGKNLNLEMNFRNLVYDLYSKDISQKVKSSLQVRKEQGQYVSANTPFGYEKDGNDRHKVIIKRDEAEIVKIIFSMAQEGKSMNQIARELNEKNIKTPIQYKIESGMTKCTPKGESFCWSASGVSAILKNEFYIGNYVFGKTKRDEVGGKNRLKRKEEWKVYPNHHEAIVSKEVYDSVQKNRNKHGPQKEMTPQSPLTGILVCSHCKKNLRYRKRNNPYYECPRRYEMNETGCCKKLDAVVLEEQIWRAFRSYLISSGKMENLLKTSDCKMKRMREEIIKEIEFEKKECIRMEKSNYENYRRYLSGEFPDFCSMSETLSKKRDAIREKQLQLERFNQQMNRDNTVELLEKRDLIMDYVDKIMVCSDSDFTFVYKEM